LIAAISVELQTRRSAGEAALSAEQNPSHHEIKRQSGRRGSMLVGLAIIAIPSLPLVAAAIGWNLGWFNKAAAPSSLPAIGTDRGDDGTGRSIARTDEAAGKQREGVTGTGDASVSRLPAAASLSTAPFSTATFSDDGSTPQLDIGLSPYDSDDRLLVSSFGLVRIDELDVARNRYWCPERAGEWGEVIYRLEAEVEPQELRTALLRCEVHVYSLFDDAAEAEIWGRPIGGEAWDLLERMPARKNGVQRGGFDVDVTEMLRGNRGLEIRVRLKATKPIQVVTRLGEKPLAGAQFMRLSQDGAGVFPLRLRVWKQEAESTDSVTD